MDICACLSAERLAKSSCVTLSMDHLVYDDSISCSDGDILVVEAQVIRAFNTSAEVLAKVYLDGDSHLGQSCCAFAYFVFVRMDKGRMQMVFPQNSAEFQDFELSMERRKARQNKKAMMEAARSNFESKSAITPVVDINSDLTREQETSAIVVPADCSLRKYTQIVLPPHANHMGNTFGGQVCRVIPMLDFGQFIN